MAAKFKSYGSDRITTVEKKGYSPPPVEHVQRPKPPPAGPRRRAAVSSEQRPQNEGTGA